MSIRRSTKSRRAVAAVSLAAALALAVTGCGTDGGGKTNDAGSSPSSEPSESSDGDKGAKQEDTAAGDNVDPNVKLAEVEGDGLTLVVNQVKRDSGGFVTVQGQITNDSGQTRNTSSWAGSESAILARNPNSVAGATLVDKAGRSATTCFVTRRIGAFAPQASLRCWLARRSQSSCSSRRPRVRRPRLISLCRRSRRRP